MTKTARESNDERCDGCEERFPDVELFAHFQRLLCETCHDAEDGWAATHVIQVEHRSGLSECVEVMLLDGVGYTRDEWASESNADWICDDGHWLFQGRAHPTVGTVEVRAVA